jgi:hypothetical protein
MAKSMRNIALVAGALALGAVYALPAEAQSTPVNIATENFDGLPAGWTLSAPMGGVGWDIDTVPIAGVGGSPCLNYNDDVDYDSGAQNQGSARSGNYTIASATYTTYTITFQCQRYIELSTGMMGRNINMFDTCIVNVYDSSSATTPIARYQLADLTDLINNPPLAGYTTVSCGLNNAWHQHTLSLPTAPVGTVAVEFVFNTVDALNNTRQGWFVDDLAISAVDPGSGGGGGGGGGTVTDGYWDPVTGIWVGFPNGSAGTPPPAAPGTGTAVETGTYDADGIYVGSTGSSSSGSGTSDGDNCGFLGLEFLLPLGLLRLLRRRR